VFCTTDIAKAVNIKVPLDGAVIVEDTLTVQGPTTSESLSVSGASTLGATTVTSFSSTGKVSTPASTTARAGLAVAPGTAPTTPSNGDVWTTATGIFARIGGNTLDLVAAVPWAAPTAAIGSTTPVAGSFTTLSASGAITSTLADGNPPFVVTSTTNVPNLNASSISGATFAATGPIGGTTPNIALFTRASTSAIGQFAAGDATPDVGAANVWRVYGAEGLTITDFDNPVGVQELTVIGSLLNEIQTLTVTDGADADTFTVSYAGQTTAALDWDISAADMDTALEALSNIEAGDIAVSEAGGIYTVTFQGTLAETNVAEITATPTGCTVTPATTQAGAAACTSVVDDAAENKLNGDWTMTGGATLKLIYDTKSTKWFELSRSAT
jgi:hypothetical protein